jgi:hypothetical protein
MSKMLINYYLMYLILDNMINKSYIMFENYYS